jgi:DNA-binding protein HU-beta
VTKAELVDLVHQHSGVGSKADAEKVIDALRDVIQSKLAKGEEVSIVGLGKFSRVARKARTARNPQTGATVKVKATKAPKFTASATLKGIVKGDSAAPSIAKPKAAKPAAKAAAKPAAKAAAKPRATAAKAAAKPRAAAAKPRAAAKPAARRAAPKK